MAPVHRSDDRFLAGTPLEVPARQGAADPGGAGGGSFEAPAPGRTEQVIAGFRDAVELGRSAQSVVYRVVRGADEYALKVLGRVPEDAGAALVAFRREAALLASVAHPLVPSVYEVGLVDGRPYAVMDLVSGRQLAEVLAGGPLAPAVAIGFVLDVLDPLAAVHRKGLVHRDLKPQNVLVQPDGTARVIDFGLAARDVAGSPLDSTVGTLAYAAPEQSGMFKRPVDARSDLYSLGVLLFECLSGRLPFVAEDMGELLRLHAMAPPPDLRELVAGLPSMLAVIVQTLLAKDPDDRYQSAANLAADLVRVAAEPQTTFVLRPAARGLGPGDPLIGRDGEVSRLFERWAQARGGCGGVGVVWGPGGIGKSRLVNELVHRVRAGDGLVLRGKSSPDDVIPMSALQQAVDGFLESLAGLPDRERDGMYARVRAAAGAAAPVIAPLSARLQGVLGSPRLADADRQQQYPAALAEFVLELARRCPGLVLYLDDVQWLDAGSRRVLAEVAARLASVPLLVLMSCRNDEASSRAADAFVRSLGTAVDLELTIGPLGATDLPALVEAHLPGIDVGSRLVQLLAVRGDGNPFVTLEYLQAIADAGLLSPQWGGWQLDEEGLAALHLPADAIGMVMARVEGLGHGVRQILLTAAALGNVFYAADVAAAVGGERQEVMLALADAASRRLIEPRDAGSYAFVHDRIREALLEDLDQETAADLHQHLAVVLAAGGAVTGDRVFAVADHVLRGHPAADPESSAAALLAAGRLALASQAREEAVRFLEPAAGLRPGDPELLRELGTALLRAGQYTKAAARLQEALHAQRDPVGRGRVLLQFVHLHLATWDVERARAAALDGLRELGSPVPTNRIWLLLTTLGLSLAGFLVGLSHLGAGTRDPRKRERYELVTELHTFAGYVGVVSLRSDRLLLHNLRNIFPAFRIGRGLHQAQAMAGLGVVTAVLGLPRLSARVLRFARAEAARLGDQQVTALVEWYNGCARYMGRIDDGEAWLRALEEHGRWLATASHHDAVASLTCEDLARGRLDDVDRCYQLGLAQRTLAGQTELTSLLLLGPATHSCRGRAAQATAELRRTRPLVAERGGRTMQVASAIIELRTLLDQQERGAPFDRAVEAFLAVHVAPRLSMRQLRLGYLLIAQGRLDQCRGAKTEPRRIAAARAALGDLKVVADTDFLKAYHTVLRADLQQLEGRPGKALQLLTRVRRPRHDAPALACDLAATRARTLNALGDAAEAERQALYALSVASQQGWPHRARWIAQEFTLHQSPSRPSTGTQPAPVAEQQRLRALEQVSAAAARVLDPDELVRVTLDQTLRILTGERAFLWLTTPDANTDTGPGGQPSLVPKLGRDSDGNEITHLTGYSASLVERVQLTREPLVVTGTEEGAALGADSVVLHGLRSIMIAPVQIEGRLLGVVYLDSQIAKGVFSVDDVGILTALTTHVAAGLETARAAELELAAQSALRQRDLAERLRTALAVMTESMDPEEVLRRLIGCAQQLFPATTAGVLREVRDGLVLTLDTATTIDLPPDPETQALLAPAHTSATGSANPTGGPTSLPPALAQALAHPPSWLILPLATRDHMVGTLIIVSPTRDTFGDTQTQIVAALAAQGMTAYDNATLFSRVQDLAVADELTGIPNRRHFLDLAHRALDEAREGAWPLSVLMVDIDHFKQVNDSHGHLAGDDVIRIVAARLAGHLRDLDVIGRYGGEEFAVIAPGLADARALAERLRIAISRTPIPTRTHAIPVTISIGITQRLPQDEHIDAALARADAALYAAKQAGRNRISQA